MNTVSSSEHLMEIRVSPAVVVVVLVLVAASTDAIAPAGPAPDATVAPVTGGGTPTHAATADKPAGGKPAADKPTANKPGAAASDKPAPPASNDKSAPGGT